MQKVLVARKCRVQQPLVPYSGQSPVVPQTFVVKIQNGAPVYPADRNASPYCFMILSPHTICSSTSAS
jgi:hypothetical protein